MVPPTIRSKLASLRRRERLLTFVFGVACWLAVILAILIFACVVDFVIDRFTDTPLIIRLGLVVMQLGVAAISAFFFLVWPQLRRLSDSTLALWVESRFPKFDHRLISAVQLNEPGADVGGMSRELIAMVTKEAEKEASRIGFAQVANHSRLIVSVVVLVPILFIALLPLVIAPRYSFALLARQAMLDVEIPRSVYLESRSAKVWPIDEEIEIDFLVTGEFDEEQEGRVRVTPEGDSTSSYPLEYLDKHKDGAIFRAKVKPARADITYTARLADGRTKTANTMKLVPRPAVMENNAWVQLPEYCGKRPDGSRFEQQQGRGDIVGIPGSTVRVQIRTQNAIKEAWLELRGFEKVEKKEESAPREIAIEKAPRAMSVSADGMTAELRFDLTPEYSGYRIIVKDEHGFDNKYYPRRSLRMVPEEPPTVTLLRDTFGEGTDSFDLEGLPVMLGGKIRIPYRVDAPYSMSRAFILYRVLKKHESGNEPVEEEKWIRLPLTEIKAGPESGPFDLKVGVFKNMAFDQQVPFHAMPSTDPSTKLGRTMGGGRFFLETKTLFDGTTTRPLKSGDQIEYCVEIHAAHRVPEASIPVGRSETRVSTVLEQKDFLAWIDQVGKEDERVRLLELKQKGVFERK